MTPPTPNKSTTYTSTTHRQSATTWPGKKLHEINSSASFSANGFQWVNSWGVDGAIPGFKSSKQLNTMLRATEVPAARPCLIHLRQTPSPPRPDPPHPRQLAGSGTAQPPKKRHHFLSICAAGRVLYKHTRPTLTNTLSISHSRVLLFIFPKPLLFFTLAVKRSTVLRARLGLRWEWHSLSCLLILWLLTLLWFSFIFFRRPSQSQRGERVEERERERVGEIKLFNGPFVWVDSKVHQLWCCGTACNCCVIKEESDKRTDQMHNGWQRKLWSLIKSALCLLFWSLSS